MSIDWSKYGVKPDESEDTTMGTSVDFGKYLGRSPKKSTLEAAASGIGKTFGNISSGNIASDLGMQVTPQEEKSGFEAFNDRLLSPFKTLPDKFLRSAVGAVDMMLPGDQASFLENSSTFKEAARPAETTSEKVFDAVGDVYGSTPAIAGAYATGGRGAAALTKRLLPGAGTITQNLLRGAGAGYVYGGVKEGMEIAQGSDQSMLGHLGDLGMEMALFGGGDAAFSALGRGVQAFRNARRAPEVVAPTATPALPMSRYEEFTRRAEGTTSASDDVIYAPGDVHTFELPAPDLKPPTTARMGTRTNPYEQKYNDLIAAARQTEMMPGREYEILEDLWSRMAGPEDPGLDELIRLAYPQRTSRLNIGSLGRARELQGQMDTYGVPGPVRSTSDRYTGFVGEAAMPETIVGRKSRLDDAVLNIGPRRTASLDDAAIDITPPTRRFPVNDEVAATAQASKPLELTTIRIDKNLDELTPDEVRQLRQHMVNKKEQLTTSDHGMSEMVYRNQLDAVNRDLDTLKELSRRGGTIEDAAASLRQPREEILKSEPAPDMVRADLGEENALLKNSDNWNDKGKILLGRETMERNFEDLMGADAPNMKKTYLEPIKKAEAERQRFISQERESVKDLGIKYKSEEDALVQQYGEGVMSLDDLKAATPNWEKVKNATETMRKKYDNYLETVNKVLVDNGYDAIPKRENYFPHYEEIDDILSMFGLRIDNDILPTDLAGRTADLKPGKNFFANALRRKGNQTTYGFVEGFDRYIEGVSKLIHHTSNIKRLRGLVKDLRGKYEGKTNLSNFVAELDEYTNILAGKKAMVDRAVEDRFGRRAYKIMDAARRRVGANMIGGSISSAISNFIPLTQALATTEKAAFLEGMTSTLAHGVKSIFGQGDEFMKKSDFLTRRFASKPLSMNKLEKVADKAGILFETLDMFTANTIVRGKFAEGIKKGLSEEEALKQADEWAGRLMADRSAGQMPTIFSSRTLSLFTQFQLEMNNQISFLAKDIPKSMDAKKAASALTQVAIYSYIYNELMENVTGRRMALDPIGIAQQAIEDFSNEDLSIAKSTDSLIDNISNSLPFVSVITGGGRIPLGAAIPDVLGIAKGEAKLGEELVKPATYLLPPVGGGQAKKSYEGASALFKNEVPGVYGTNADGEKNLKYPVDNDLANIARGLAFGKTGFPETNDFYRNDERALSAEQTKQLENSSDPEQMYGKILDNRRLEKLENAIRDIQKNKKLSPEDRQEKIAAAVERLRNAAQGR